MIAYLIDDQGIFIDAVEIDPMAPLPGRCIFEPAPPAMSGAQVARWDGAAWSVLEQRPVRPEPEIDPLTVAAAISAEVQRRLDAFARTREYDDIGSLASYAGDPDPQQNLEGTFGRLVRSQTWVAMKAIRSQVLAGQRPMPTSLAEIEAELPALEWPA